MSHQAFSVSMCVYGKDDPAFFDLAVKSILEQSAGPSEVVLVVDGPIPPLLEERVGACEARECFRVIRLKENMGQGNARRIGMEACSHELVALMDADDISCHDRFEKQLAVFSAFPHTDAVGGIIAEFCQTPDQPVAYRSVFQQDAEIKTDMKKRCPMNLVTVMLKRSSVLQAGGFVDWYGEEDYYLWLRMARQGMCFYNLQDILVKVRVGEAMYRRRGGLSYFKSEAKLQKYMLDHKLIGLPRYLSNLTKRFVVQVLLPNRLRSFLYQKFARKQVSYGT